MRARAVAIAVGAVAVLAALAWGAFPGRADAGGVAPRWECTRFKVPESLNPSVRGSDGVLVQPPAELGAAFRPYLTTVVLPEGFQPFGGGDGSVIACRQGGR